MDYTKSGLVFKIKKTIRYLRLYGVQRTAAKVQAQYHMNRKYAKLPAMLPTASASKHVGIIGCGNFAYSNIAYYLKKNYGAVVRGCMDPHIQRAASLFQKYEGDYYADSADRIFQDQSIDLVFIASNHASHAEYAIQALNQGKSVHIEKPHVVNESQLERLCEAMAHSKGKVALGFNRPHSSIGLEIKRYLDSQQGPSVFNWFIAGHEIPPDHWYFNEEEGGRVLGNLCHWIDFVYQMVPDELRFPVEIVPTPGDNTGSGLAVTYRFADNTVAAITFSAKGHTFEGVRERFAAHRGDVLIAMDDFKHLTADVAEKKYVKRLPYRDHGHEAVIRRSYQMVRSPQRQRPGCTIQYVWETGMLFLKTKSALDRNEIVVVERYAPVNAQ
jgi:predicted dehydrogenase